MTGQQDNVGRFVASARRLIVIQVIMTVVALIAAGVATFLIYRSLIEQREAVQRIAEAEVKEDNATKATADLADFSRLVGQMRSILQADTPEEFGAAAAKLRDEVKLRPDEDAFTLLATAYYRSAPPLVIGAPDDLAVAANRSKRVEKLREAADVLLGAVRLNQKRVADYQPDSAGSGDPPRHSEALYLELVAMQCALVKTLSFDPGMTPASALDELLKTQPLPEDLKTVFIVERKLATHPLVMRECGPDLTRIAATALGVSFETADDSLITQAAIDDAYRISRIFLHVRSGAPIDLAVKLEQGLEAGEYKVPGIERVAQSAAAYRPSVRYYYDEQKGQAGDIQRQVAELASANGASWTADAIPLLKVDIAGLPRERVEVWLPDADAISRGPAAAMGQQLDRLDIVYYQRPADGLTIRGVLDSLLDLTNWTVAKTQIAGDINNGLGCHPAMPPETFAQFKQLTLALFDAGMPIMQIKSYNANTPKAPGRVEILYFPAATKPLARADLEALMSCPPPNAPLLRP